MNPTPEQAALTAALAREAMMYYEDRNSGYYWRKDVPLLAAEVRRLQAALAEKDQQIAAAEQSENEDTQKFFLAADKCEDLEEQLAASQQRVAEQSEIISAYIGTADALAKTEVDRDRMKAAMDALTVPGRTVFMHRTKDGNFSVSSHYSNPRLPRRPITGEGATLEAAVQAALATPAAQAATEETT